MITKAFIIEKQLDTNKFFIRIPIFEKPGISSNESKLNSTIFLATLSHEPTSFDSYNVGDCVFVGFENNDLGKPVILGKLFLNKENERSIGALSSSSLVVKDKAVLPTDTTIGDTSLSNILNFFSAVNDTINKKDLFVDTIKFSSNNSDAGLVQFDDNEGTLQVKLSENVEMSVGVDEVLKVYNDTDETLVDGTVVYRTGVKKETNAILEDYQLVSNSDLLMAKPSPNENQALGFTYSNFTNISLSGGIATFTPTAQFALFAYTNHATTFNTNDTYYMFANVKSSSNKTYLSGSAYNVFHSGNGQYQFLSLVRKITSTVHGAMISTSEVSPNFTPIEVDYIGAYNISDMILNGVKDDNGVLFSDLTNEEIRVQLDKWIQRGVSGTTKVQPAIANNSTISNNTIGVVTETIESHKYGFITRKGFVGGILLDPNIYTVGQTLYLSPDVEGAFTNQRPVAPNFVTQIGYVNMVSSDSYTADGQIYVDIRIIPISSDISYDNSDSDLDSQTVKDALDELSLKKADINSPASAIITDVSQFNGILSSDDVNVQHALNTIDNHTHALPVASDTVLGAIKIGDGLNVASDGTVSVTAEAVGVKIIVSNIQPDPEILELRSGDFWYEY